MTCAKATVTCTIVAADGRWVVGTNACRNPQPACPRAPGEDYTKCSTICDQQGHAEVQAKRAALEAGIDLLDATAHLEGHTYYCMNCQHELYDSGVGGLFRGVPPIWRK